MCLIVLGSWGMSRISIPPVEFRWLLDRFWLALLTAIYVLGGVVLSFEYRKAEDPILRRQLKWLRNGTFYGIMPFAFFYALPYAAAFVPTPRMKSAGLSLLLVPLTRAYAIVAYRLMAVEF